MNNNSIINYVIYLIVIHYKNKPIVNKIVYYSLLIYSKVT